MKYKPTKVNIPMDRLAQTGGGAHELPPFYEESLEELSAVQAIQRLHVGIGLERLRFEGAQLDCSDPSVKVAFCSTHLRRDSVLVAMAINLALTWRHRAQITWFLADFNFDDDRLCDRLTKPMRTAMWEGHLRLYCAKGLDFWHASIAKNTSHMLPNDSYDALCNVDGDNLLTVEFVIAALEVAGRIKSGDVNVAQFYSTDAPGTYGRIMIKRSLFHALGGYDEDFHPVGCQDFDLLARATCCSKEGAAILISDPRKVGASILNTANADWSTNIRAKMFNVDPGKYEGWKFGKMDQLNRVMSHDRLALGRMKRNESKQVIGVPSVYVELEHSVDADNLLTDFEPDFEPDWSPMDEAEGVPHGPMPITEVTEAASSAAEGGVPPTEVGGLTPASEQGGTTTASQGGMIPAAPKAGGQTTPPELGGVTPAQAEAQTQHQPKRMRLMPPPPAPADRFSICTFGVEKLHHACRKRNAAAKILHDEWLPTKGKAPQKVRTELVEDALGSLWHTPHVVIDARVFRPDKRIWTDGHTGYSYTLCARLVDHPDWPEFIQRVCRMLSVAHRDAYPDPLRIAVFCRAGEKRSVSVAFILHEVLKLRGWVAVEQIAHLCSMFWPRKTCAALNCQECNSESESHRKLIRAISAAAPPIGKDVDVDG